MSEFIIEIDPPIDSSTIPFEVVSPTEDEWSRLAQVTGEYNIVYHVSGQAFCYYASSLATLLNDILWEWEQVRCRESHLMTLSGYAVLAADFDGNQALIYDPVERARYGPGTEPIACLSAANLEEEFRDKRDAIWAEVRRKISKRASG